MKEDPSLNADGAAFDAHARAYRESVNAAVAFTDESVDDFARQKVALMLDATQRLLGDPRAMSMLDVGCGIGLAAKALAPHVRQVVAGDVSAASVEMARADGAGVEFVHLPPRGLPFDADRFDVQYCFCVYHHVAPADRAALVDELARVVKPGGLLFVFEHNPLNPVTRHVVRGCPLDADAVLLRAGETRRLLVGAGLRIEEQRFYLFFPKMLAALRRVEPWLGWLPLGGQYYVAARKPR